MALTTAIVALIEDEIGPHPDFSTNTVDYDPATHLGDLESIYEDVNRGGENPVIAALIVWRRRLMSLYERSFDLTTEGSLLSRNQKVRYAERRVAELALLVDTTLKGKNMEVVGSFALTGDELDAALGTEFS